ncbi:MAG: hypothetical protein Q8O90_06760, partial [Elusimicrobiota bacterium]|nr:hypothetical protein [Elusimicrobiota bacterium]
FFFGGELHLMGNTVLAGLPGLPERKTRSATPWPHSVFARRAYASAGLNDGFANPAGQVSR